MTKLKVLKPHDSMKSQPLWVTYDGQDRPQPAYFELDLERGTLRADWESEVGTKMPEAVWHQRTMRFGILPTLTVEQIAQLADEFYNEFQAILDVAYFKYVDGVLTGFLTDEAQIKTTQLSQELYDRSCEIGMVVEDTEQ